MRLAGGVVLATTSGLGGVLTYGRLLRDLGATPLLLTDPVPESRQAAWREVYERVVVVEDPYDPAALARGAVEAAAGVELRGLFTGFDGQVIPAAIAARDLGLPHPRIDGLRRARVKYAMRCATRDAGLPTPRFGLVHRREDVDRVAREVGLPAVVKPLNGLAGHLVQRVGTVEQLAAAYDRLVRRLPLTLGDMYRLPVEIDPDLGTTADATTTFLVEELLTGREFSAELVVRGGKVDRVLLLHKFLIDPTTYFEQGFTWPPVATTPAEQEDLWQLVERTLAVLGVDDTVAHVEVMLTGDGPHMIEVNAGRPGGQIIPLLPPRIAGVDMALELVAVACGVEPERRTVPDPPGRLATMTIFPERSGKLTEVRGLDELERLAGVEQVIPFVSPGDELDISDKEIFAVNFLVSGIDDPDALVALYERARRIVSFDMAEPQAAGVSEPAG